MEADDKSKDLKLAKEGDKNMDLEVAKEDDNNKDLEVPEKDDKSKDLELQEEVDKSKDLELQEKDDKNKDLEFPDEDFFPALDAETTEVTVVRSLCVNCGDQGTTQLMMTRIPFYQDVIVSSFLCDVCGYKNSELSSAKEISPVGVVYALEVKDALDLNRMVVKSDNAHVIIPELDLEIPARTQKGEITSVEGILRRVAAGLSQDQLRRKDEHQEAYNQIEEYLKKIEDCLELKSPFTLSIRDISGHSYIGTRPDRLSITDDPSLRHKKFSRTIEEDVALGIGNYPILDEVPEPEYQDEEEEEEATNFKEEVLQMATNCPECNEPCLTKMKVTDIPLFKEVIIMATDCDKCGCRSNEVKSGGGVEPKGKRIKLKVKSKEDFSRDVLKSDTCQVEIPELELEAGGGAIVAKFTTVEGLMVDIKKQLSDENPLIGGDSVDPGLKEKMSKLCVELERLLTGDREFTLILDDPAGNCYIQNVYAPDEDPELSTEHYERTFEQNEELGLNDMNVGGEEEQAPAENEGVVEKHDDLGGGDVKTGGDVKIGGGGEGQAPAENEGTVEKQDDVGSVGGEKATE